MNDVTLADEDVFSNENPILDDYVAVNVDDDAIPNVSINDRMLSASSSTTAFDNLVAGFAFLDTDYVVGLLRMVDCLPKTLNSRICAFGYVFALVVKMTRFPLTTSAFLESRNQNTKKSN